MKRYSGNFEERQALSPTRMTYDNSNYDTFDEAPPHGEGIPLDELSAEIISLGSSVDLEELENSLPSSRLRRSVRSKSETTLRRRRVKDGEGTTNEDGIVFIIDNEMKKTNQVSNKEISGWRRFKLENAMGWKHFKDSSIDFFSFFDIWKSHMKEVEGKFGTGVLSYFVFLRWLVLLNIAVSVLLLSFIFVPQMIHGRTVPTEKFTGIELLTGEGWFDETELFYGTYTNATVNGKYEMRHAYLLVGGGYLIIVVIILAASMAKSYKKNYVLDGERMKSYSSKVFCSWDYNITNEQTAIVESQSIAQNLLESLGSSIRHIKISCQQWFTMVILRICTNIIVLALMATSVYLIVYVSDMAVKVDAPSVAIALLPAISISAINLLLPVAFRLISSIESYHSARTQLSITLVRTIILKLATVIVYVIALHTELERGGDNDDDDGDDNDDGHTVNFCWENFVGQAFYKLVIIDFLATIIATLVGEFIRKLLVTYISWLRKWFDLPGFDISKNVLYLIYAQAICWLGTFYCPLLPVINVIKLIITFYIKKVSVMRNCRPTMRPFKASKMNLVFLLLLSVFLVFALVVTGYIVVNTETLRPSTSCGPFRGQSSIYQLVEEIVESLPKVLKIIVTEISSVSVIAAIVFLMGLTAYYFRLKKISCEKKIKLLKRQIQMSGQDKQFLIAKLRAVLKRKAAMIER